MSWPRRPPNAPLRGSRKLFANALALLSLLTVLACGFADDDDSTSPPPSPTPWDTPTPGEFTPTPAMDGDGDTYVDCQDAAPDEPCDCNDHDKNINPSASELCDGVDQDCDNEIDNLYLLNGVPILQASNLEILLTGVQAYDTLTVGCGGDYTGPFLLDKPGFTLECAAADKACHMVTEDEGSVLRIAVQDADSTETVTVKGFTIFGGTAARGGGIEIQDTSTHLSNLLVRDNEASMGGGIAVILTNKNSEFFTHMSHLQVTGNQATSGGGIYLEGATAVLDQVQIWDNSAPTGFGGGMAAQDADVLWTYGLLYRNEASWGGALHLQTTDLEFKYGLISGNIGTSGGGVRLGSGSSASMTHTVLVDNSAIGEGGAIRLEGTDSIVVLEHCIAAFNFSTGEGSNVSVVAGDVLSTFSCFYTEEGSGVEGADLDPTKNVYGDPLFMGTSPGENMPRDIHLSLDSPLVDGGDPSEAHSDPDASPCDLGVYGGPDADAWDLDLDEVYQYFWPGTIDDRPYLGAVYGDVEFETLENDALQ